MKIEKGMLIGSEGQWFVVVEALWRDGALVFHCICDNANNIHAIKAGEVEAYLELREVGDWGFATGTTERLPDAYFDRKFPHDVMIEVLSGRHDHRFDHWAPKPPSQP